MEDNEEFDEQETKKDPHVLALKGRGFLTKKRHELQSFIERSLQMPTYTDYCQQYQFDHFSDAMDFNDRFNSPELGSYADIDVTMDLFSDLTNTIMLKSNVIFMIFGPRNMSKSEVAQAISFEWKRQFKVLKKTDITIHLSFDDRELSKVFKQMKPGDIAIRDESPKASGTGTTTAKQSLENICNITRGYQVSFIFINPTQIDVDGVDFYIEVAGKDRPNRRTRCILYDRKLKILGMIYIDLHNDDVFRKEYERRKSANIVGLMSLAGLVGIGVDGSQVELDAIKLYEYCKKQLAHKPRIFKTDIRSKIPLLNDTLQKTEKIMGITEHIAAVVDLVSNMFENPDLISQIMEKHKEQFTSIKVADEVKKDEEKQLRDYRIKIDTSEKVVLFSDFCRKFIKDENVSKVAEGLARGDSNQTIIDNYAKTINPITYPQLQRIATELRTGTRGVSLDVLLEMYIGIYKLGIPADQIQRYIAGGRGTKGKLDIDYNGEIWSVKIISDTKQNTITISQSKDLTPEYEEAKKRKKPYILGLFNPKWTNGTKVIKKVIFPDEDDIIVITKPAVRKIYENGKIVENIQGNGYELI